jgi:SecD/SecF fusion protein
MTRPPVVRALLALAVVAASLYFAITSSARLGLDLRGGTQIVLEAKSTDKVEANAQNTDKALEVLRNRVDALGVSEPTLARAGATGSSSSCPACRTPGEPPRSSGARRSSPSTR